VKPDTLFGVHVVREWLAGSPERIERLIIAHHPNERVQKVVDKAVAQGIPIETVTPKTLKKMAGPRNPQGIGAYVKSYAFQDLDDVLDAATDTPLVLALDGVTDPGNLGAIARSAGFFGATAIVLPQDRSASVTPVVERAAAGALAHVPICRVNSLRRTLAELQERGLLVAGAILGDNPPPRSLDLNVPLAVVVGSEGKGIRPSIRKLCDYRCALTTSGQMRPGTSLNVSAFVGIFLYEISCQRTGKNGG
jgi:23S rRNA (guanosine2251-2'-O)-methyltransferase